MQIRRPPVGGGSHMDEEDRFPAAQRDQPANVQEGTEGFKVVPLSHALITLLSTHSKRAVC